MPITEFFGTQTHTLTLNYALCFELWPLTPWIYVHVYVIYLLTLER